MRSKIEIAEWKGQLDYIRMVDVKIKDPAKDKAFEMASKALDIVGMMPDYKDAFPNSAVLDAILTVMKEKGFEVTEYDIKGMY